MGSIFIFLILIQITLIQTDTLSFQENLFKTILQKDKGKNILISPFSIYQILALTSNGAAEETLEEMLKVLIPYKNIDNEIQNTLNLNLIDIIEKITPKEEIQNDNENNNEKNNGNKKENNGKFSIPIKIILLEPEYIGDVRLIWKMQMKFS